ncbi:MAG: excinuclease ABC subunit UvrC [Nitrospirota bacterium]
MLTKPEGIPSKPGVYLFKGPKEHVLYVGKAKDLKKRLQSYFQKISHLDARKASLINDAKDLAYIVTSNELEAFVLEANLIKQHKPRFNIILRDDKNYPYLKLTVNEEWPRIEVVRKIRKDGALYFGPYVPAGTMWETLALIRRNFQLGDCKYRFDKTMRPCIQYQMGKCLAPCAGLMTKEEYLKRIEEIRLFLSGEKKDLLDKLRQRMELLSEEMKYEEAAQIRDRLRAIERAWESQKVLDPELGDLDVIGYSRSGRQAAIRVFFIRSGIMIGSKDFFMRNVEHMSERELVYGVIAQLYSKEIIPPAEIIVPALPEDLRPISRWLAGKRGGKTRILMPGAGKKKELLGMASENADLALRNRKVEDLEKLMKDVQDRLNLDTSVESIGACDVSNISGSEAVGAFIYWAQGEFRKDRYRRLKIRTVSGVDDYAMMEEVLERLTKNLKDDMPDLLIIDGGKGHLETAKKVIKRQGGLPKVPALIGLAKDPDRAFLLDKEEPLDLEDRAASSLLLKGIRDEAHRFAVGYHRKLRDKELFRSRLEGIKGIGKRRRLELLRVFGSIENIRKASPEVISAIKGFNKTIAEKVVRELRREE